MTNLLDFMIDAHDGIDRWTRGQEVHATVDSYGSFWGTRGQGTLLGPCDVVARLDSQHLSAHSRQSGYTIVFDGDVNRVTVSSAEGELIEVLDDPRTFMLTLAEDAHWTPAQVGYFIGYGIWSYVLEPYVLTLPGLDLREIEPWSEFGETWRRLEVTFPPTMATHSSQYVYYFDAKTGLQRRIDYSPEVNGSPLASHYTFEHRFYEGLPVPSSRRILRRNAQGETNYRVARILQDVTDFRIV